MCLAYSALILGFSQSLPPTLFYSQNACLDPTSIYGLLKSTQEQWEPQEGLVLHIVARGSPSQPLEAFSATLYLFKPRAQRTE